MVSNLWKNTKPICARHLPDEKHEMTIQTVKSTIVYKCPICQNEINSFDFEKSLSKISNIYSEQFKTGEWGSVVGEKFVLNKRIYGQIIKEDDEGHIEVALNNVNCK